MIGLRRRGPGDREAGAAHDDAIWRGEVPDHLIIMTAAERARLDAERLQRARRRSLVELFGEPVGAVAAEAPSVRHQRRGNTMRPADMVDQRRSAGCREEIQVSILAHPVDTVDLIAAGDLLGGLHRLDVDATSEQRSDRQITWDGRLSTTPCTQRAVRLRLYGSPSANVTVVTLTPRRSRRLGVRLFLRAGLGALYELSHRVEDAIDHSGRT